MRALLPGRRITAFFVFTLSLITTQACSFGNEISTSQETFLPTQQLSIPNTNGACDNPLYPVRQGASWTYISSGGPNGMFAYTETITEIHADGFTLATQLADLTRTQAWACETDGLKALQLGGGTTSGISTQGITAEFTTSDISGINLPKELTAGRQWQYQLNMQGTVAMPGEQQSQSNGTYSAIMQEVGRETVSVPAGTFDAVKIQINSNVNITANFQGVEIPITFNGASIVWYAPGIGYVKSVENGDFSGTVFTAVTELQTYIIP